MSHSILHALVVLLVASAGCSGGGESCAVCVDEKCSDLVALCDTDPDCACMVDCLGESGIPGVEACLPSCGLTERPAGFYEVEACTGVACPDTGDECSTPADWTPPEQSVTCDGTGSGGLGGGSLADCSFEPDLGFDPDGAVLQLESADQTVCARVERRDDGAGTLANTEYTLLDLRVGPLGQVAHVDSAADLCWYASHHNFRDWAHAWTGNRHFDLELEEDGHSGARSYFLFGYEQGPLDGASCAPTAEGTLCIDGPIELFPVNP